MSPRTKGTGFTLIELLVVLAIVALLMTIAVPRYVEHVERARETALRTDLKVMRDAIETFEQEQGRLPKDLEELVARKYLKAIPVDPITDKRDSWVVVSVLEDGTSNATATDSRDPTASPDNGMSNVHSGARGKAKDGTEFSKW